MKKLTVLSLALIVALFSGMTSCSSSKDVSNGGLGVEKAKSPAQIYWEANPKIRAYGQGTRLNESVAASIAENDARVRMTRSIEVAINNVLKRYNKDYEKAVVNDTTSKSAYDASGKNEEYTEQIASQILKNVSIVKYNAYLQKNGETTVHLCLEYMGDANALAETITDALFESGKIKYQISDDEKSKTDKDVEAIRNEMHNDLKKEAYNSLDSSK